MPTSSKLAPALLIQVATLVPVQSKNVYPASTMAVLQELEFAMVLRYWPW